MTFTKAMARELAVRGYVVVDDVVPKVLREAVIGAVASFLGVDPDDALTRWAAHGHGIVPLHHHQARWDVRQHPPVHAAGVGELGCAAGQLPLVTSDQNRRSSHLTGSSGPTFQLASG